MRSLSEFQSRQDVFRTPSNLPSFFDDNLVDPLRIVKVFEDDPQAHIRVFYFQYLKLCFEVNHPNSEALVQKIQELINNPTFTFIFYQQDDSSIFNDSQAKRFISQFFGVLSSGQTSVLESLNNYPIMDTIMVHFFRTLMVLMDKAQSLDNFIPRDELLSFLCSFFGIQVELHDACIKYVDTDVFVFDQSQKEVYMAYINYFEQPQSQPTYQQEKKQEMFAPVSAVSNIVPGQASGRAPSSSIGGGKESYIASEFYDYTQDNAPGGGLANKGTTLKGSDTFLNPVASSDVQQAKIKQIKPEVKKVQPQVTKYVSSESYGNNYNQTAITTQEKSYLNKEIISKQDFSTKPQLNNYSNTYNNATLLNQNNLKTIQNQTYNQTNIYTQKNQNLQSTYKNTPINSIPQENKYSEPFTVTSYPQPQNNYAPPPPLPKPALQKDIFYVPKEAPLYNPKIDTTAGSKVVNVTAAPTAGKKKLFGLNVSEQFTNSLTIKSMAEPHKTNVINIKTRARNFRTSLANYLK